MTFNTAVKLRNFKQNNACRMDSNIRETSAYTIATDFLTRLRKKGGDENRLKVARQLYE